VTPGSVTGFSVLNDQANRVRLVVGCEALLAHETLNFHPLRNDMTTSISREDFLGFADGDGPYGDPRGLHETGRGLRTLPFQGTGPI
jgi:hypothetical protein